LVEESAFGYDEMSKQTFYGLLGSTLGCAGQESVIVDVDLAPANAHELHLAEELLEEAKGWALGDRNYWSPDLTERLETQGLHLLSPYKSYEEGKGALATLVGAKAPKDRDGDL
jgi:hypothetical protein